MKNKLASAEADVNTNTILHYLQKQENEIWIFYYIFELRHDD